MSAKSFILALIRFTNLFGIPECIYSDNARSFVSGCDVVEKHLTFVKFQDRFENLGPHNPPLHSLDGKRLGADD